MAIKLGDGVIQVAGDFRNLRAQMGIALGAIATTIGTAMLGAIGGAVSKAIEFETAFAGVKKTVAATAPEFAKIRQEILDLSREIPLTASELAKIAEIAGQLGIKKDDIASFTETIAKLGFTTDLAGEEAATLLAQFVNITGFDPAGLQDIADVIVTLGNNSATSESKILELGTRIAAAGTISGIADENILAIAAAFASVGTKAEAGGTVISRVLLAMNDAVIVAGEGVQGLSKTYGLNADELQALAGQVQAIAERGGSLSQLARSSGLTKEQLNQLAATMEKGGEQLTKFAEITEQTAQEFADAWKEDPAKAFEDVVLGLERIKKEGKSMGVVLDDVGLKGVRIGDIMGRGALNADGLGEAMTFAQEAMSSLVSEMDKEFAEKLNTAAAQLQLLINDVSVLAIEIGTTLLPAIRDTIDMMRPWLDWLIELVKAHPDATRFVGQLTIALGALLAFLGPLVILIASWKIAFGGAGAVAAATATATASAATAMTAAAAAMTAAATAMTAAAAAMGAGATATTAAAAAMGVGAAAAAATTTAMVASTAAVAANGTALVATGLAAAKAGTSYAGYGVVIDVAATSTAAATGVTLAGAAALAATIALIAVGVAAIAGITWSWWQLHKAKKALKEVTKLENAGNERAIQVLKEKGIEIDREVFSTLSLTEKTKFLADAFEKVREVEQELITAAKEAEKARRSGVEATLDQIAAFRKAKEAGASLEEQFKTLTGEELEHTRTMITGTHTLESRAVESFEFIAELEASALALKKKRAEEEEALRQRTLQAIIDKGTREKEARAEFNRQIAEESRKSLKQILTDQLAALEKTEKITDEVHKANKKWSPGTEGSPSAVQLTSEALRSIVDMNIESANAIFEILDRIHSAYIDTWSSIASFVGDTLSGIASAAGSALGGVGGFLGFGGGGGSVENNDALAQSNRELATSTAQSLGDISAAQIAALRTTVAVTDAVHRANEKWSPGAKGSPSALSLARDALDKIMGFATSAANTLFGILESIRVAFVDTWTAITDAMGGSIVNTQALIGRVMDDIRSFMSETLGSIQTLIDSVMADIATLKGAIGDLFGVSAFGSVPVAAAAAGGDTNVIFNAPLVGTQNNTSNVDAESATNSMLRDLSAALTGRGLSPSALSQ